MIFRIILSVIVVAGAIALQACEDDPILQPQHSDRAVSGSYGRIVVDPAGNADSSAGKIVPDGTENPEIF